MSNDATLLHAVFYLCFVSYKYQAKHFDRSWMKYLQTNAMHIYAYFINAQLIYANFPKKVYLSMQMILQWYDLYLQH